MATDSCFTLVDSKKYQEVKAVNSVKFGKECVKFIVKYNCDSFFG